MNEKTDLINKENQILKHEVTNCFNFMRDNEKLDKNTIDELYRIASYAKELSKKIQKEKDCLIFCEDLLKHNSKNLSEVLKKLKSMND